MLITCKRINKPNKFPVNIHLPMKMIWSSFVFPKIDLEM